MMGLFREEASLPSTIQRRIDCVAAQNVICYLQKPLGTNQNRRDRYYSLLATNGAVKFLISGKHFCEKAISGLWGFGGVYRLSIHGSFIHLKQISKTNGS